MIEEITKKEEKIIPPFGEIGYIITKRTYARRFKEDDLNSSTEEYEDIVKREIKACRTQLKCGFNEGEEELYFKTRMNLKWSVAGRFMWQLGTKTVDKLGLPSLQNCAFCVVNEPIKPFTWAFNLLMLGSGVGFNIQRHNVYQMPKLKHKIKIERNDAKDADFIVPDTREGWIKLLGKILKAHFYGGEGFTFSTICIRGKDTPIKGFGGTASGPEDLCKGMLQIHDILNNRSNKKLRPIDCLDIMNIIGSVVVAGNVRRSAQVSIGDFDDIDYLKAKRWDLGSIPNWRAMSNNSVACDKIERLPKEFWETYEQGEPYGLINLDLAKVCGRTGETQYSDMSVEGFNPCCEQSLENFETCCLSEIYLPNINSYDEFINCLRLAYRVCKHSLALPCAIKETETVVHKNMRMGIGITGVLQCSKEQLSWLDDGYKFLREFDKIYSKENGFNLSIKLTTVKPSGTLSLIAGVTPGIHPSPAGPYYIRRVRIASGSNLVDICRKNGYEMEYQKNFDGTNDHNTMVVSFPCKVNENVPIASNYTWKEQIELVKWMQKNWSDNAVSCTIYYKKEDLEDIKEYLKENYSDNFKTLSFLLYNDHGFIQAPYETITKEKYDKMIQNIKKIEGIEINESDFEVKDCENGSCPIK